MKSTNLSIVVATLGNIVAMLCWTYLALYFGKWWIASFACLCFTYVKVKNTERSNGDGQ